MLDDASIARYARQIVIPGVGAAGQERLLQSTVLLAGNARGCDQARLYLRAAGVETLDWDSGDPPDSFDVAILASDGAVEQSLGDFLTTCARPVCWYSCNTNRFTAGVHPQAPLSLLTTARHTPNPSSALHDAAAADAAAVACAILLGLPWRSGPHHFDL